MDKSPHWKQYLMPSIISAAISIGGFYGLLMADRATYIEKINVLIETVKSVDSREKDLENVFHSHETEQARREGQTDGVIKRMDSMEVKMERIEVKLDRLITRSKTKEIGQKL